MQAEIERKINDLSGDNVVKLDGKIKLRVDKGGTFTVGRLCVKGIITVMRSGVIIDGGNAEIEVDVNDCTTSDWSLFFIHPSARNVQFRNMNVKIKINNPHDSTRMFSCIYNMSYGLKLHNCRVEIISYKQLNIAGLYNNGNLDTHMDTRADNLVISDSFIKTDCRAETYGNESTVYGIYNYLANSISVQNTFIYATNIGNGARQTAIGVYTNGRFGRFVGNNIKANGSHNKGREKERAHAYGFINEGLHSLIESNNIVGEWAGMSVGLENKGEYAVIEGNKILATHTICGRSIRSYAAESLIQGNVLTSTSRNARLIEHNAECCIISKNVLDVLMVKSECQSGCGIYAVGENCKDNIISENVIKNAADCAILADKSVGDITGNRVVFFDGTAAVAGSDDKYLSDKLDERNIRSIFDQG